MQNERRPWSHPLVELDVDGTARKSDPGVLYDTRNTNVDDLTVAPRTIRETFYHPKLRPITKIWSDRRNDSPRFIESHKVQGARKSCMSHGSDGDGQFRI